MYKCYQNNIVSGKEFFPLLWIIGENLLYILTWVLAAFLIWPLWMPSSIPVLTITWVLLVFIVQVLLKKHNCSGCYYYNKLCHLGWGKIAAIMFKQDSGDPEVGKKLSLFYIIPPPLILLSSLIYALVSKTTPVYWAALGIYILLNVISFPLRIKGCGLCAMREVCPGSAVKKG